MKSFFTHMLLAMSVGVFGLMLASARVGAQENHGNQASSEPQTIGGELAKESREAAGEDKNEALKHSSSVQWISKKTGLSVHGAYLVLVFLNFAIIAGIVIYFGRKYLPGIFRNRTADIQKAMEEARKASAEANRRLAEIEARLTRLDVEIGTMQANAEKEVEAEEQRIATATQEETRKIVDSAEQEIAAAAKLARRELKAFAADLAVALASKQIKVDPKTDQALVGGFAHELTQSGKKDS